MILRSAGRFRSSFDGVESWHSFSTGGHYDPDNVAFGAVIGVDEHRIAPGAGFGWHPHRGVAIVSWVVSGRLRHEDSAGRVRLVGPGEVLVQRTGRGIRHAETNASPAEALRLVQTTFLDDAEDSSITVQPAPAPVGASSFEVWRAGAQAPDGRWHGYVVDGQWSYGTDGLGPGDSVRGTGPAAIDGAGELLVCRLG